MDEWRKCHDNGTGTYAVERMKQMFVGPLNPETGLGLELFTVRLSQFSIEGGRETILNAPTHRDFLNPGEILIRVELRDLLGLGDSPSASVDASHLLTKWSQDDGFLVKQVLRGKPFHTLK